VLTLLLSLSASKHRCITDVIVFERTFIKRFAVCYQTVVCLSVCLSCPVLFAVCNGGVLWPNSWMDQDETWPWPHCVRWGPSSPFIPPIFDPYLLWPNGWMDQDATWYGGRPRPKQHCVRWGSSSPPQKMGQSHPNFQPMSIVAKRLEGSRCHLAWR